MAPRLELQALLDSFVPEGKQAYFQPPSSIVMSYPCIVYKKSDVDIKHADNRPYSHKVKYQITVVDADPDSDISTKVAALPTASFDQHFVNDGLNHDVYSIFF